MYFKEIKYIHIIQNSKSNFKIYSNIIKIFRKVFEDFGEIKDIRSY